MTKLKLTDIIDLRAYEREREQFRAHIIAIKKVRRVGVGPFVTFLFESRETIRFQIQEMARAEKIVTDQGIETELDIYNPLVPGPGHLAATMFLELTNDEQMRHWFPLLVGIETTVEFRFANGTALACTVDPDHAAQLTRADTTAAVHYIHFELSEEHVAALGAGSTQLAVTHPEYTHAVELTQDAIAQLLADLRS